MKREMPLKPPHRARRCDRLGQIRRKRPDKLDRSGNRGHAVTKRGQRLRLPPLDELLGQRSADPLLDRSEELRSGETDELAQRVLCRRLMAELGQQLGEHAIALIFAFEQHAVEVEDDRLRLGHQSSNRAVPTRTAVAPSVAAASKSADIPMLKPATSWRRPSSASNAK